MTPGTLRAALDGVRLDGAIFLRAEYTEAWSYESPSAPDLAGLLRPGRERLVLFHIVAAGSCWVSVGQGERHWAARGDVIVLPYGDQHRMGGADDAACVPIATLLAPPPWTEFPVIRHGAGGDRTDVVCGYLDADDPLFDPALRALPAVFVVRPSATAAAWVEASIAYALEASSDDARTGAVVTTRLPELLLVEVLRLHLADAPAADHGWLAALRDPVLAPALALVHGAPERKWTVADLAAGAAVSRSLLDERFRAVLGRPPIRYLTEWRIHLARELLTTTPAAVSTVARQVGYDSEEAFSRAFKRALGQSPAHWRANRATAGSVSAPPAGATVRPRPSESDSSAGPGW
jgi:AraC-like DNA-binding protein